MNITLAIIFAVIGFGALIFAGYWYWKTNQKKPQRLEETIDMADSTRQMPEIDESMEIPEEDQKYLMPVTIEVLKKLAFSKRMTPTNAMLIEHLSETLAEAAKSFEPRSGKQDPPQTGNEDWLFVAAFAIRLYMEGSAHNCKEALDAFVTDGHLSQRRLMQWATKLNSEIASQVRRKTLGEDKAVQDITQHVQTIAGTPYTEDEVNDMKDAADQKNKKDSKFRQALRGD